jgi:hypothetical protein
VTDQGALATADWQAPHQTEVLPWCAAVIVGPLGEAAWWVGDLERILAWAWLDRHG